MVVGEEGRITTASMCDRRSGWQGVGEARPLRPTAATNGGDFVAKDVSGYLLKRRIRHGSSIEQGMLSRAAVSSWSLSWSPSLTKWGAACLVTPLIFRGQIAAKFPDMICD